MCSASNRNILRLLRIPCYTKYRDTILKYRISHDNKLVVFLLENLHVKEVHFRNHLANNNIQERFDGEFRDKEKVFRGLKKEDSPAITGIKLHHNFIKPHIGLNGGTPADRAGIEIKGDNKWLTIIQNASIKQ